jgi:UDP-N-acetylglucosamine 2-epimerase
MKYFTLIKVFQNICHKVFLVIPQLQLSIQFPMNMRPKVNTVREIDLRSSANTFLIIT